MEWAFQMVLYLKRLLNQRWQLLFY